MELKKGKITILYDELSRIRKMGKEQLERYLTAELKPYLMEARELGYRQGYTESEEEADAELRQEAVDRAEAVRHALDEHDRKWRKAVRDAVAAVKGVGRKRKELLMEYLKIELERAGICRR